MGDWVSRIRVHDVKFPKNQSKIYVKLKKKDLAKMGFSLLCPPIPPSLIPSAQSSSCT